MFIAQNYRMCIMYMLYGTWKMNWPLRPYQFENMVRGPYLPKKFSIQKIMIVWGMAKYG